MKKALRKIGVLILSGVMIGAGEGAALAQAARPNQGMGRGVIDRNRGGGGHNRGGGDHRRNPVVNPGHGNDRNRDRNRGNDNGRRRDPVVNPPVRRNPPVANPPVRRNPVTPNPGHGNDRNRDRNRGNDNGRRRDPVVNPPVRRNPPAANPPVRRNPPVVNPPVRRNPPVVNPPHGKLPRDGRRWRVNPDKKRHQPTTPRNPVFRGPGNDGRDHRGEHHAFRPRRPNWNWNAPVWRDLPGPDHGRRVERLRRSVYQDSVWRYRDHLRQSVLARRGWHYHGGYRYYHHPSHYGWVAVYTSDGWFWVRWHNDRWWWHHPGGRWLCWQDDNWWYYGTSTWYIWVDHHDHYYRVGDGRLTRDDDKEDVVYSPDGTRVVYITGDERIAHLYKVDVANPDADLEHLAYLGQNVWEVSIVEDSVYADSYIVIVTGKDGRVALYTEDGDLYGGAPRSALDTNLSEETLREQNVAIDAAFEAARREFDVSARD